MMDSFPDRPQQSEFRENPRNRLDAPPFRSFSDDFQSRRGPTDDSMGRQLPVDVQNSIGGAFSTQQLGQPDLRSQQPFTSKRVSEYGGGGVGIPDMNPEPMLGEHSPTSPYPPLSSSLSNSQRRAAPAAPPMSSYPTRSASPGLRRSGTADFRGAEEPFGQGLDLSTRRSTTPKGRAGAEYLESDTPTDFRGIEETLRMSRPPPSSASSAQPSNSKAVLSALRALQEKIRKLESEKAYYQESYETTRRTAAEFREEVQRSMDVEQKRHYETVRTLEIEKDALTRERAELTSALATTREQAKALETDLSYFRQLGATLESEKKVAQARVEELEKALERTARDHADRARDLEARLSQLTAANAEMQERLRSAESALVTERRARADLEDERSRLSTATKEMVRLNQNLKDRVQSFEVLAASGVLPPAKASATPAKKKKTVKKSEGKTTAATTTSTRSSVGSASAAAAAAVPTRRRSVSSTLQEKLRRSSAASEIPLIPKASVTSLGLGAGLRPPSSRRPSSVILTEDLVCDTALGGSADVDEGEIEDVINQLESEYVELNEQYHKLLTQASDLNALSHDQYDVTGTLKSILDRLEQKSEQLKNLRRYQQTMADQLREATSPSSRPRAIDQRAKVLKLLNSLKIAQSSS